MRRPSVATVYRLKHRRVTHRLTGCLFCDPKAVPSRLQEPALGAYLPVTAVCSSHQVWLARRCNCRFPLYRIKAPPLAARAVWRCTNIHPGTPGIRFAAPVGRAALRAGPQAPADCPQDLSVIRPRLPTSASAVTTGRLCTALDCRDGYAALPPMEDPSVRRSPRPDAIRLIARVTAGRLGASRPRCSGAPGFGRTSGSKRR